MDPAIKNLRQWVLLLFVLFIALDMAAVQYGMRLAQSSPSEAVLSAGRIAVRLTDFHGYADKVYVTPPQLYGYYGLLGAGGLALLAMLTVIVVHGINILRADRRAQVLPLTKPPSARGRGPHGWSRLVNHRDKWH